MTLNDVRRIFRELSPYDAGYEVFLGDLPQEDLNEFLAEITDEEMESFDRGWMDAYVDWWKS
jgi:hypothetical protein